MDDMLAGGASLAEVQESFALTVTEIEGFDRNGQALVDGAAQDAFADYTEDGQNLLSLAYELQEGETSIVTEISGGRFAVVEVTGIQPKSYRAFEDVNDELTESWSERKRAEAARERAQELVERVKAGERMEAIASADAAVSLYALPQLKRDTESLGLLQRSAVPQIFNAADGDVFVAAIADGVAVVQLLRSALPSDIDADGLADVKAQLESEWQNSSMQIFAETMRQSYGTAINDNLLRQVYGRDPLNNPLLQ